MNAGAEKTFITDYISEITIEKGKGALLYLTNGKILIDLTSGATVANLGHGNKRILEAILTQGKLIENTYLFDNAPRIRYKRMLLDELNRHAGNSFYQEVTFLSSGSEAIDCALKASISFTKKTALVSTETSFHGRMFSGMELSRLPFSNILPKKWGVCFFNYPRSISEEDTSIEELNGIFSASPHNIAAVVLEPYQGDGGMLFPTSHFFSKVSQLCRQNNTLFILDEIQSGFGRTGSLFNTYQLDILPDIICIGKAMANGFPTSAVISAKGIISSLKKEHTSNSFGGNPLSMAASIAVLKKARNNKFLESIKEKGKIFIDQLQELKEKYPLIREVRGKGLIIGIELDASQQENIGDLFVNSCYNNGLLVMPPKGTARNVIKISPPLIVSVNQINTAVTRINNVFKSLQ